MVRWPTLLQLWPLALIVSTTCKVSPSSIISRKKTHLLTKFHSMDNNQSFSYTSFDQKDFYIATGSQYSSLMVPYYNTSMGLINSGIPINFNHTCGGFLPSNWILNVSETLGPSFVFTLLKKVSPMHHLISLKLDFAGRHHHQFKIFHITALQQILKHLQESKAYVWTFLNCLGPTTPYICLNPSLLIPKKKNVGYNQFWVLLRVLQLLLQIPRKLSDSPRGTYHVNH